MSEAKGPAGASAETCAALASLVAWLGETASAYARVVEAERDARAIPLSAMMLRGCRDDLADLCEAAALERLPVPKPRERADRRPLALERLEAVERRLLALYGDAIARTGDAPILNDVLRQHYAARRSSIHALHALVAERRGAGR